MRSRSMGGKFSSPLFGACECYMLQMYFPRLRPVSDCGSLCHLSDSRRARAVVSLVAGEEAGMSGCVGVSVLISFDSIIN